MMVARWIYWLAIATLVLGAVFVFFLAFWPRRRDDE